MNNKLLGGTECILCGKGGRITGTHLVNVVGTMEYRRCDRCEFEWAVGEKFSEANLKRIFSEKTESTFTELVSQHTIKNILSELP